LRSLIVSGDSPARLRREALAIANRILCPGHDAPEACSHCRRIDQDSHPDLIHLRPDGTQIKVEDVREAVRFATGRPYEASARLIWIEQAESLRDTGANALLKSLEEPGESVQWILTTTSPESLPTTVRSRCVARRISPRSPLDLLRRFESAGLSPSDARDASAFEFEPDDPFDLPGAREQRRLLVQSLAEGSVSTSLALAAAVAELDNGPRLTASLLRDAAILAAGAPADRLRHFGAASELGKLAKVYRAETLREAAAEADALEEGFQRSRQKRLAYERLFLRLCRSRDEG
jgi:DNA polymerase-3 subunit delta'